jgi:hypothetical protein
VYGSLAPRLHNKGYTHLAVRSKSPATYKANILAALQQTGIKNTSPGGKARAFCDIVGDQLGILDKNKAGDLAQSLLSDATGTNLDLVCQIFGVTRLASVDASSEATEDNFQFYVLSGTGTDQVPSSTGKQTPLARLAVAGRPSAAACRDCCRLPHRMPHGMPVP